VCAVADVSRLFQLVALAVELRVQVASSADRDKLVQIFAAQGLFVVSDVVNGSGLALQAQSADPAVSVEHPLPNGLPEVGRQVRTVGLEA
jgi:hypothetical protein